jgi:hypothetical protein
MSHEHCRDQSFQNLSLLRDNSSDLILMKLGSIEVRGPEPSEAPLIGQQPDHFVYGIYRLHLLPFIFAFVIIVLLIILLLI